jgi:hypothetical protein
VQPSEILHGRPVLIERGSFRPVTNVTLRMLDAAVRQIKKAANQPEGEPVVLMEMTLKNLTSEEKIDQEDFVARSRILEALNKTVLISNYSRFDLVTTYLRQYTQNRIGMVAGVPTLRAIFDAQYYVELEGGILEGLGRLFQDGVNLFVYPTVSAADGGLETADNLDLDSRQRNLYQYLFECGAIVPISEFDPAQLHLSPGQVLQMIQSGDPAWINYVPAEAVELIERDHLFGYTPRNEGVSR